MKRKYITIFGIIMVGILLMNTALALCEDGNYSTSFLYLLPSEDGFVDSANPTTNYKTADYLENNTVRQSYMMFDISSLPSNSTIVMCDLYTWVTNAGTLGVYEVDSNSWDEDTVTYNSRPLSGDLIDSVVSIQYKPMIYDVADWVTDRYNNSISAVSFNTHIPDSDSVSVSSKEDSQVHEKPYLVVEYGTPIDPLDTTIKSQVYNFADVTDADLYNNYYYAVSSTLIDYSVSGSESNSAYTSIGTDDGNYSRVSTPVSTVGYGVIRFETKIDQNVSDIRRIEIKHKYLHDSSGASSTYPNHFSRVYDYDSLTWVYNNTDIYGCDNEYRESTWFYKTLTTFEIIIVDNFDKYINEDGVLKYASRGYEASSLGLYMDTYYYQVEVFYYEAPVITPPVVDDGDDDPIVSPVYPDLTDDNPIISVDGTYSGDLQNVLFRNLININDNYGIPTWAFILIGGIIGVWKRRPELVIFCGLLFLFLLFFGYKLTMAVV